MRKLGHAGMLILILVAGLSSAATAEPNAASKVVSPPRTITDHQTQAIVALFKHDWVLMNWALRFFDTDGDVTLSPSEAAAAAAAFRKLADIDRDGRITPTEYRLARHYIKTRY